MTDSTTPPLNLGPTSGLVLLLSSQGHNTNLGVHSLNPPCPGRSLQPPPTSIFAPQGHVTITSSEGDSCPKGVS